jgi:hypothetical protein
MERSLPLSSRKARRTRARSWAKPVAGCACRNHADATLSTMAVNEPDRGDNGDWEAALEAVEQFTVAVSRVAMPGRWRARSREEINDGGNAEADA